MRVCPVLPHPVQAVRIPSPDDKFEDTLNIVLTAGVGLSPWHGPPAGLGGHGTRIRGHGHGMGTVCRRVSRDLIIGLGLG